VENSEILEPIINVELVTKNGNTREEVINHQKSISSKNITFTFKDSDELLKSVKVHKEEMRKRTLR